MYFINPNLCVITSPPGEKRGLKVCREFSENANLQRLLRVASHADVMSVVFTQGA